MKIGIFSEGYVPSGSTAAERLHEMIDQAVLAEKVGLNSYGCSEQHFKFHTNSTPQPDLLFAAIARETSKIRLAADVVVLPLHHPLHVAERIATLDVISRGRVDFGIGRGNTAVTADAFGISMKESGDRSLETLDIILQAWKGEKFSYEGRFYKFDPLTITPFPQQKPYPPIYWAALSPSSHEQGGRLGYHLLTGGNAISWDQLQRRIDAYIRGWNMRPGDEPYGTVRVNVHGFCADTTEKAHELNARYVVEYVNRTVKQYAQAVARSGGAVNFDASERYIDNYDLIIRDTAVAIGTPDECIRQLMRLADMGVDEVTIRLDGPSDAQLRECITLLGKEVAPAVANIARRPRTPEVLPERSLKVAGN